MGGRRWKTEELDRVSSATFDDVPRLAAELGRSEAAIEAAMYNQLKKFRPHRRKVQPYDFVKHQRGIMPAKGVGEHFRPRLSPVRGPSAEARKRGALRRRIEALAGERADS